MSARSLLKKSIIHVLNRNKHGAFGTQKNRRLALLEAADIIVDSGYKLKHIRNLKQKHVFTVVEEWQKRGLTAGTIKNKLAHLRWVADEFNKNDMIPSNDQLGIERRTYITNKDKSIELSEDQLKKIKDKYIYVSVNLELHLGLRREEALKIKPHLADKGDRVELDGSWCKGGRKRTITIISKEARFWLDQAKELVKDKNGSLIPSEKTYKQHLAVYEKQLIRAGINNPHGLRHAYIQNTYKELTGWECPARGGPTRKELTKDQKKLDVWARKLIAELIGHSRLSITNNYLGR